MKTRRIETMACGRELVSFFTEDSSEVLQKALDCDNEGDALSECLYQTFADAFETDGENELDHILHMYDCASDKEKAIIDNIFVCLCGWSFLTLVKKAIDADEDEL